MVSVITGSTPVYDLVNGRVLRREAGLPEPVALAARDHYSPLGPSDDVPKDPVSIAVALADKIDQVSAFQNFIVMPLTFLSGVFYSMHSLPPFWQVVSHFNPVFYIIDGFRYGFFGVSDVTPWFSIGVVLATLAAVSALALALVARGYKLRH